MTEKVEEGAAASKQLAMPSSYTQWLITSHKLLLVRWAQLFIIVMCASMLHPTGRLLVYRLYSVGFIISLLGIASSTSAAGASKRVQFWFGVFALLQVMVIFQMAYIGVAPAVHNYLDWATSLSTLVPQMLVLDLTPGKLALLLLVHIVARFSFYRSVVGHAVPLAMLRATCLIVMCEGVFLMFRQRAVAAYLLLKGNSPAVGSGKLPSKGCTVDGCPRSGKLHHESAFSALFECLTQRRILSIVYTCASSLLLFVVCHAGASTLLYHTVSKHVLPLALLQALGLQAVGLYALLCVRECSVRTSSRAQREGDRGNKYVVARMWAGQVPDRAGNVHFAESSYVDLSMPALQHTARGSVCAQPEARRPEVTEGTPAKGHQCERLTASLEGPKTVGLDAQQQQQQQQQQQ